VEVRNPDDKLALASAVAAGADILITGDKDLLDIADPVERLQGLSLRIMTPRTFWEEVR
jgi:predicted nucleic acid-binding protein